MIEHSLGELRFAFRALWKRPGFSIVALVTLALGIGAATAIYSVVDAVLLRPLPFPQQEQIVELRELAANGHSMAVAQPNYEDFAARTRGFDALAEFGAWPSAITGGSEPVRANTAAVSEKFFRVLGVKAFLGRLISEKREAGAAQTAVVSCGFWRRFLNSRADLDGTTLEMEGHVANVIGVLPPGVEYPPGTDIWFSRIHYPGDDSRTAHNWAVIGRLRPDVIVRQAQAEATTIGAQLKRQFGGSTDASSFSVQPLRARMVANVRDVLFALLGAVALLLVISCSNVANLLLVRANSRRKEIALRAALGASRARLAWQFVAEALILSLAACVTGIVLANWCVDLLLALYHGGLTTAGTIAINIRVLGFSLGISVFVAVVLGLICAVNVSRRQIQDDLQTGSRNSGAQVTTRLRNIFIIAQVALTLMLLVGAGLLGRSFQRLLEVNPGFRPDNVVAMTVWETLTDAPGTSRQLAPAYAQLIDAAQHLPGVQMAGATSALPLSDEGADGTFRIEDGSKQTGDADYRLASGGYFSTMGIPLVRGRLFHETDGPSSPHVALVSESLARRYWPNDDAIGKQIQFGNMDGDEKHLLNIVGIVGDVRDRGLDARVRPTVYANYFQRPSDPEMSIVVRGQGAEAALINELRDAAHRLDPGVPTEFHTLQSIVSTSLDQRRFSMVTLGMFAGTALLLAMVGLYGVMAFLTAQRTHEIGIRMALGAQRRDMVGLILQQSLTLVLTGVAIGIAGSLGGGRLLASLLYGTGATDLVTYLAVIGVLVVAAALASFIPARRATKVDPVVALRAE